MAEKRIINLTETTELTGGDYLVVDSASSGTRKVSGSVINSAIGEVASDLDTLSARVDQIIAPSGEAPSAAEVSDARVGADGVTYPTLGGAIRTQVTDLKDDIKENQNVANEVSFEILPTRTYNISSTDVYKNAFITFPLTVGKTYTIANKSSSAYIAVFSCTNAVSSPSSDVETLAAGLNAGRSTEVTVTSDANYIRCYCTATPAVLEITLQDTIRDDIEDQAEFILSKVSESGNIELSYLEGMTMNTSGVIYGSAGNNVAYAKVYKGMDLSFYAENSGTMELSFCRVGFFSDIPEGGDSPDISFVNGTQKATVTQDCYVAFTRPSYTVFACSYVNNEGVIARVNDIEYDYYSTRKTMSMTMLANTAINSNNGYYFEQEGWTAGTALVPAGSDLTFYADDAITNCRYTIFENDIDYDNIVSYGVGYGVMIPTDKDYYIMISAPSVVTQFEVYVENIGTKEIADGYWYNKKIVWFGTSIPAGVVNAGDSNGIGSYPERLGQMLKATVYNEAVGSSRVRGGSYKAITQSDPMGWAGMSAIGILLSLSLSSTEKQSFIDDWDSTWSSIVTDSTNVMDSLTADDITAYKNTSWDIKLAKYLTGGSVGQCDLYVFDHGYNDGVATYGFSELTDVPATANDRTYFLGAMAFLIEKILADNPLARICFIGHWSNDKGSGNSATSLVAEGQEKLADVWKYPLFKTWEHIGWSANTITSNGVTKPVYEFFCIDGVHPSSDTTGNALKHYAETLYPFMRDVR